MKNLTRIGASLLGTWTAETQLATSHGDTTMTAYLVAHFMPDPRSSHGCDIPTDCSEFDNDVCMLTYDNDAKRAQKSCRDIAEEKDVSWSDLTVFFNFGVRIESKSSPKVQLEMNTGDWIGPWNLVMAQDTGSISLESELETNDNTMVDRYVSRYVQSQSMSPPFLQDIPPTQCTLYNKADDFATFLGNAPLNYMTRVQTNFSIAPTTNNNDTTPQPPPVDPYAPYLQTCSNGNLQPILPQMALEFINTSSGPDDSNTTNHTFVDDDDQDGSNNLQMAFKLQYKIMAVPTKDEQAYRVLPKLQSKFQGQGGYNIIAGPYCYGDDPKGGYSFDLNFDTTARDTANTTDDDSNKKRPTLVQGCVKGYPCVPPAAMGQTPGLPSNSSCDNNDHHHDSRYDVGLINMLLSFGCYFFTIAFLMSATYNCHLSHKHKQAIKKQKKREDGMLNNQGFAASILVDNNNRKEAGGGEDNVIEYLGGTDSGPAAAASNQNEDNSPFGDLDHEKDETKDPLQEPLLSARKR